MPFEPRLIAHDNAPLRSDGELDLPDDLAALAEQLVDDAAHLAAKYPADAAPQVALAAELVRSAQPIHRRSWVRVAVLVAGGGLACVAVFCLSLTGFRTGNNRPLSRPAHGAIAEVDASAKHSGDERLETVPSPGTLSLGELSGPEMEALLDLLHHEPQPGASVSF